MSDYNRSYDRDDRSPPRRYQSSRTRPRDDRDADYMEEKTYVERGKGRPPRELVSRSRDRGRDRDDSVESIRRDFPPPGSRRSRRNDDDDDYYDSRRTRSAGGSRRDRDRDRDRYSDDYSDGGYGPAAAGGAAGYAAASRSRGGRSSRRDRNGYRSDDDRSPKGDDRRKSGIEGAIEGLGLGGLIGALTGKDKDKDKDDRDRSRSRSRTRRGGGGDRDDRDRSRSRGGGSKDVKSRQWAQAAQAALVAGAIEAFRARKEPGSWTGSKGKRIATAAISAGGIDKTLDKDPEKKSHRHLLEAVVGGLATTRLANGPVRSGSKDSRGRSVSPEGRPRSRSRSRSILDRFRSRSRGGRDGSADGDRDKPRGETDKHDLIRDLVAGGALAATGKKIFDSVNNNSSKKKSRRQRSPSAGSRDSYDPPSRNRRRRDVGPDNPRSRSMPPPDQTAVVGPRQSNAGPLAVATGGAAGAAYASKRANEEDSDSASDTDIENQKKKMTRKEMITAGLALVATIHAAHGVYNGIEASHKRHKLVEEGKMSPEVARKKKSKALLQDAAAVGIAALGIKGAYSEWKEMNENRHHVQELKEKRRRRQKRREARLMEHRQRLLGPQAGGMQAIGNGSADGSGGNLPPPPMGHDRR